MFAVIQAFKFDKIAFQNKHTAHLKFNFQFGLWIKIIFFPEMKFVKVFGFNLKYIWKTMCNACLDYQLPSQMRTRQEDGCEWDCDWILSQTGDTGPAQCLTTKILLFFFCFHVRICGLMWSWLLNLKKIVNKTLVLQMPHLLSIV